MELIEFPRTMRDAEKKSYPGLIPFLLLLQRQSRAAFESFAVYQAYQAWVLLRPGVEAVLMVGKFLDDPKFADIWQNRKKDPEAYRKAFSGKKLQSGRLPASDRIQGVLSRINDDFVHANVDYYLRHLAMDPGDPGYSRIWLDYFDSDESPEINSLAFLHLLLVMQESLAVLFARLFRTDILLKARLDPFLRDFGPRVKNLASRSEEARVVFGDLGLVALENLNVT